MKSKKKVLVTLLCAVLLVFASVMGTLAYLKADTGVVNNTFTVGKVAIDLDEEKVDVYGDDADATKVERVKANTYKLIPGHNYMKDPKVYVKAESEQAYVFVKVVNGLAEIEATANDAPDTIAEQMAKNGWVALTGVENVYYYNAVVDARTDEVVLPVFGEFTLTGAANVEVYANATITIDAYAVQADGFGSAAAAWTAASTTWE